MGWTMASIVLEDSRLYLHGPVSNLHQFLIPKVRAGCEGRITRAAVQLYKKYCNLHNILGDISEFKRGQIVGVCLVGTRDQHS